MSRGAIAPSLPAGPRPAVRSLLRRPGPLAWVAPGALFVLCFALYPLGYAIYISFFTFRLTDPLQVRTFIGLGNYLRALGDPVFRVALVNTLTFVILAVTVQMILGLVIAVLLNRDRPGTSVIRTLLLAPLTLTPLVVALVWKALYNTEFGVVSYYLTQIGVNVGRGPVAEPSWALVSLAVVDIWQWTPLVALMLLASLRSQSPELYEAAQIDGASGGQQFLYIALPLLTPIIVVALLVRTMDVFKLFDSVFAVTGGGPGNATEVLNHYVFKTGLVFFDMGYAAAMSNLLLVLIALFSAAYFRAMGRLETSG